MKLQVIKTDKHPEFEMLPAVAPTHYPFEAGSFKPYAHFRLAVQKGVGLFIKCTAYEQYETIAKPYTRPKNLADSCTLSFALANAATPNRYVLCTFDIYGRMQVQLCQDNQPLQDITKAFADLFTPVFDRGFSEVGFYWEDTMLFPFELTQQYLGADDTDQMLANCYIYSKNPAYAHLGSVGELTDLTNNTPYRTDGLLPLHTIAL